MGPLFFPPLKVKREYFDFNFKKVKRVYFQFYYETSDGNNRFRLRAYAIGKKRKPVKKLTPIILEVAEIKPPKDQKDYFFPRNEKATELTLGQLELSNVQIKKLMKNVTSDFLLFTPREVQINPFCLVYDVTDGSLMRTIETANPCPPAPPPADNVGDT